MTLPSGNRMVQYKCQNYKDLKKQHFQTGTLFLDVTFPAVDAVIGTSSMPANIVWKRPKDIADNPRLVTNVDSPSLILPGEFSSSWAASALTVLSGLNELRNKVLPNYWDQEWNDQNYSGIFHFQFWRFGCWVDVVIDDLLPTVDNVLLTTQSSTKNEFWVPLLEKAYVKLHGSYVALCEGQLADALVDFTGGVCETIDLTAGRFSEMEEKRTQLFEILHKENADHSIICFSVTTPGSSERTELGLVRGHSYHLTDIKKTYLGETTLRSLFNGREKVVMVRFNESGFEEKKPPSSPDSALSEGNPFAYPTDILSRLRSRNTDWQNIRESERQRIGLNFRSPREFWMPLEDAVHEFSEVTLCRLVTKNVFVSTGKKWKGSSMLGSWIAGPSDSPLDRSGGGDVSQESFLRNPQYLFNVKSEAEIIFQLLQFSEDEAKTPPTRIHLLMGFHVIKVEENRETRLHKLWDHTPIVITGDHKRSRELSYRGTISKGKYILVPTLYKAGDSKSYLVSAFSQSAPIDLKELKNDVPKSLNPCSCFLPETEWVTVLIVENAEIKNRSPGWIESRLSPFCVVTCEGNTVRTGVSKDDVNPEWNTAFVFYRKKPNKPINLKVLNKNTLLPNELIGECQLPAPVTHSPTPLVATLIRKSKAAEEDAPNIEGGTVNLTILTEDNLMAV